MVVPLDKQYNTVHFWAKDGCLCSFKWRSVRIKHVTLLLATLKNCHGIFLVIMIKKGWEKKETNNTIHLAKNLTFALSLVYAFYSLTITVYFGTFIYTTDTAWDGIPTLSVLVWKSLELVSVLSRVSMSIQRTEVYICNLNRYFLLRDSEDLFP